LLFVYLWPAAGVLASDTATAKKALPSESLG
jgi:hypothetical protein